MLTKKLGNVGFTAIATAARVPFGLDALARYPLFPPEFLDFIRDAVPPDRHDTLVYSVVVTGRKPLTQEGDA